MLEGLWSSESILVLVCWAPKKNLSVDVWLWSCVCACLNVFVCVCLRMCVRGSLFVEKQYLMRFFSYLPLYYDAIKHNQLQWINISHYLLYIIEDCACTYTSCITSLVVRSWWAALVGCTCGRSAAGRRHMWVGVLLSFFLINQNKYIKYIYKLNTRIYFSVY